METDKIAAYIRVSTPKQSDKGNSLETQEESIRTYIKRAFPSYSQNEIDFYKETKSASKTGDGNIISDSDIQHGLGSRPKLRDLVDGVAMNKYNHIIVYTRDRLARNMAQYLALKKYFESHKVNLRFSRTGEDFNLDDKKYNRLLEVILASFAELESRTISTRVRSGCLTSIDDNSRPGARTPYGFKPIEIGDRNTLTPLPEGMKDIHTIYELYVHKGLGYRKIANEMNKQLNTFVWTKSKVESILKNEIYTGKSLWGKRTQYSYTRDDKHPMILKLPGSSFYLSEDLWKSVNDIRNIKNQARDPHYFSSPFLLKDKLEYFVPEEEKYKKMGTRNYGDGNLVYRVEKGADSKEYYILDRKLVDQALVQQLKNMFTPSFKSQALNLLRDKHIFLKKIDTDSLESYSRDLKELNEYVISLEKLLKGDFDYQIRDRIEEQLVYARKEIEGLIAKESEVKLHISRLDSWEKDFEHQMNQLENVLSDLTSVAARMFIYLAIDSVKLSVVNELLNIKIQFNFTES